MIVYMISMAPTLETLVDAFKAAGEPTRARILALLRRGDLAVGELVQILAQSQPRLSHHLKTLTTAGLVERLPEGSWVFYRPQTKGWAGRILQAFFAELDLSAAQFVADREALEKVRQTRATSAEAYFSDMAENWDRLRALHYPEAAIERAIVSLVDAQNYDRVIDLGTGTGRMLTILAPYAREAEGLDLSHHMLTVARANLNRAAIRNARVRQGDVTATPLLLGDFAPHDLEFLRESQGHRRLGIREDDIAAWADAAGLDLQAPTRFDPPASLEQGLSVLIWTATRPANQQEVAA